jgi:hypothetical protein
MPLAECNRLQRRLLSGTPTATGTYTFTVSNSALGTDTTGTVKLVVTEPVTKVTICHRTSATTNPYRLITVSVNSIISDNGHGSHNTTRTNKDNPQTVTVETDGSGVFNPDFAYPSNRKWWGDIIPPFTYSTGSGNVNYEGLNWGTGANTPIPTGGSGADKWIVDADFATAANAWAAGSTASDAWRAAVSTCVNLSTGTKSTKATEIDDPDKFFKVMVENGADPDEIRADLVEQENDGETVPTTENLQNTYETSNATVRTDNCIRCYANSS